MNTKKLPSKASNSQKQRRRAVVAASVDLRKKRKQKRTVWEFMHETNQ